MELATTDGAPVPRRSPALDDPIAARFTVRVAGGALEVARAGPLPSEAEGVVLAVHGVTASHLTWRTIARELLGTTRACVLAPDLRGRGHSASLPSPYGIAAHVADLLAVLDAAEVNRVVVAGHSMGAWVGARLAAEHPERVSGVVLLDAGLAFQEPEEDPDEVLEAVVGPAVARLSMTFESAEEYVGLWRAHPAFARDWNDDVDAYARYDMAGGPGAVRCVVSETAVRKDSADLLRDGTTRTAVDRVCAPLTLLRAERGLLDGDDPLIPDAALDEFVAAHPDALVDDVPDVNHYTLVLGAGHGPLRAAAAIGSAIRDAVPA
jgi:pimeloyl-ACP methyl ester carboxylesterase